MRKKKQVICGAGEARWRWCCCGCIGGGGERAVWRRGQWESIRGRMIGLLGVAMFMFRVSLRWWSGDSVIGCGSWSCCDGWSLFVRFWGSVHLMGSTRWRWPISGGERMPRATKMPSTCSRWFWVMGVQNLVTVVLLMYWWVMEFCRISVREGIRYGHDGAASEPEEWGGIWINPGYSLLLFPCHIDDAWSTATKFALARYCPFFVCAPPFTVALFNPMQSAIWHMYPIRVRYEDSYSQNWFVIAKLICSVYGNRLLPFVWYSLVKFLHAKINTYWYLLLSDVVWDAEISNQATHCLLLSLMVTLAWWIWRRS